MVTSDNFETLVVAQDDDNDYDESGWVAVVDGEDAYLAQYSHCSCYGTWTSLCGGSYSKHVSDLPSNWYVWKGTRKELVEMATRKADPAVPEREIQGSDCDGDHLCAVYEQVVSKQHEICPEAFV
jgi:hypothetical protein